MKKVVLTEKQKEIVKRDTMTIQEVKEAIKETMEEASKDNRKYWYPVQNLIALTQEHPTQVDNRDIKDEIIRFVGNYASFVLGISCMENDHFGLSMIKWTVDDFWACYMVVWNHKDLGRKCIECFVKNSK